MATKMETSLSWRTFCTELEQRLEALDQQLDQVRDQKRSPALAAARGDASAGAELGRLNAKLRDLETERDDAALALQGAQDELAAAEARESREAELGRLQRLRELARAREPIANRLDQAIEALVASLAELAENSEAADALLGDDRTAMLRWWSWQSTVPELLAGKLDRAGIRLELDRPARADDSETAATAIAIGAAAWSDGELERLADDPRAA